jgi:peptide/nickel transport system substrate-binding protein
MRKLRLFQIVTLLVLVAMVSAACGTPEATPTPTEPAAQPPEPAEPTPEPPAGPKVLRLRQTEEPQTLDPAFHVGYSDTQPAMTMLEGLVAFKPGTYDLVNLLAETIEQSADGLRIDFKLREGVQFHGGYGELTTEDVKFSFERFLDQDLGSYYYGDWAALDHVEVIDEYTGAIILKEPFVALYSTGLPIFTGMIVSKAAVEDMGVEEFALNPVGTGPYEMSEFVPGQKLVVKKFDDYWGEAPEWDEIEFLTIVEDSATEIALESGELDFGMVSPAAAKRLEGNEALQVFGLASLAHHGLALNVQHPKLEDINVRLAIRYAIDAPSIIQASYEGTAARACSIFSPSSPGYWEDAPCHDRDLDKARDYMAEAGLESLDLTLTTTSGERELTTAEVIQANLAEIGINVEIIPLDVGAYWEGGFGDVGIQERELTWIEFDTPSPDPWWPIGCCWTCEWVGEWNFSYWCNEEFDQLHYAALQELDPDRRAEMYNEMVEIWDEDAAIVWVAHPVQFFAGRADLVPAQFPMGIMMASQFTTK